jgi:RimJ/RimL family protein N-acetyltransferase
MIRTERLQLSPVGIEEAADIQALTDDPRITRLVNFLPTPFTLADAQSLIRDHSTDDDRFYGIRTADGQHMVGVLGIHLHGETEVEIGYWIGADHHGRGYASEVACAVVDLLAREFPHRRIIAECRPENKASWRVLEKAGFRPTGQAGDRPGRQRLVL